MGTGVRPKGDKRALGLRGFPLTEDDDPCVHSKGQGVELSHYKGVIVTREGQFCWASCYPNDTTDLFLDGFPVSEATCFVTLPLESPTWDLVSLSP